MGAFYNTMRRDGDLTKDQLRSVFEAAQQQDRYENGHMYSGGFGMAAGLSITDKKFTGWQEADEYLQEHCQKWENALAVRLEEKGEPPVWYIAAWCAS